VSALQKPGNGLAAMLSYAEWTSGSSGRIEAVAETTCCRWAAESALLALLALLVLHANEVVSGDRLIDALWASGRGATRARCPKRGVRDLNLRRPRVSDPHAGFRPRS